MIGRTTAVAVATALMTAGPAHAALLKGTVTGSPYVAGAATTAVPVTFSKQSAQGAGLHSPVGVIVVPRQRAVPAPQGAVAPMALRLGDRFRFSAAVPRTARDAVYTRLATSRLRVYKRSQTLSNQELTTQLTSLFNYVSYLQDGISRQLAGVRDVLGGVVGAPEVATLIGTVDTLQRTLAATLGRLAQTGVTGLPDATAALGEVQRQLAGLQQQVGAIVGGAAPPAGGAAGAAGALLNGLLGPGY